MTLDNLYSFDTYRPTYCNGNGDSTNMSLSKNSSLVNTQDIVNSAFVFWNQYVIRIPD